MKDKDGGDEGNIRYLHPPKSGEDSETAKYMYYQVTPVVPVKEGERLMKLHYLTESGYLDILGLLNKLQEHNLKKIKQTLVYAILVAVSSASLTVLLMLGLK